ncbi:hypothetical protein Tco_0232775 [Tanacetum coccineum]
MSLELKLQHNKESFQNDKPCENRDAPEFHEFFTINELKAQLQAKDTTINNLKKHIQELKGKSVADCHESVNKPKVIAPSVLKLDLEPLSLKLKNNREAHIDYIRITKENVDTLRDIVEQARTSNSLDNTSPSRSEKLVVGTPINKARKVSFAKTSTTSENNTQKRVDLHKTQTTNKPLVPSTSVKSSTNASRSIPRSNIKNTKILQTSSSNQKYQRVEAHTRNVKSSLDKENSMSKSVCSTCKKCLFDANHGLCVVNYLSDVNARARAKSVKGIKKNEWKTTGLAPHRKEMCMLQCALSLKEEKSSYLRAVLPITSIMCSRPQIVIWSMASEQFNSRPGLQPLTLGYISLGLMQNPVSLTLYVPPSKKDYEILFQPLFDKYFNPLPRVVSPYPVVVVAPRAIDPVGVEEQIHGHQNAQFNNAPLLHNLSSDSSSEETTLQGVISLNLHHLNQSFDTLTKLTKNHPLENVIGDPSRSVSTRSQLQEHAIWCYFDAHDNPIIFVGKQSG